MIGMSPRTGILIELKVGGEFSRFSYGTSAWS
jgi:hypothetical protein